MFIKLAIIAGIVIIGLAIFSSEIETFFPSTSTTVIDSLKEDVSNIGTRATDTVTERIDESIDRTGETITAEITGAGERISEEISGAQEASQDAITDEISGIDPIRSIQDAIGGQ